MTHATRLAAVWLACAVTVGCAKDTVFPGYYGQSASHELSVRQEDSGASGAPPTAGMASSASSVGSAGSASFAGVAGGGSVAPEPTAGAPTPPPPSSDACDLSGRWLATLHEVTDAIGQQQTAHTYVYYEIERQNDAYVIKKGLHCGDDAAAEGVFAVTVDFSHARDAVREKISYLGRRVESKASAGGCDVHFAKWFVVQGATYPHYADGAIALPTIDQKASGTTPGWEDWDGDGQPGITGIISGAIAGRIFLAPRVWTELSGTVPSVGDRIKLKVDWDQIKNVLGYDGSELLASDAVRAADPSLHFAELARLDASRATGDDAAICRAVLALAKTLTPTAAGI